MNAKTGQSRYKISQGIMKSRGRLPTCSVIHSNVNVLLSGVGNDFFLLLALEVRQLLDSLLDDFKSALNLFVSNN